MQIKTDQEDLEVAEHITMDSSLHGGHGAQG